MIKLKKKKKKKRTTETEKGKCPFSTRYKWVLSNNMYGFPVPVI
jgi:hypothetical protein